jgi:hypothetical protein
VLAKLGVRNRVTAAIYAYEVGVADIRAVVAVDNAPQQSVSR